MPQVATYDQRILRPIIAGSKQLVIPVTLPVGGKYGVAGKAVRGLVVGPTGVAARPEIRTIALTGTPTGAKITVTWTIGTKVYSSTTANLVTTEPTAAEVVTMLEAIFGTGTVAVVETSLSYAVTFQNLLANKEIGGIIAVSATFTAGTSPGITHTRTQIGSTGPGQFDTYENSVVAVARGILIREFHSDPQGGNITENGGPGQPDAAEMAFTGTYRMGDLTGLDANAVGDLGRIVLGAAYSDVDGWITLAGS